VFLGRPKGLLQSDGGRSAAETTWSSSSADRVRCPKNFSGEHFTLSETGEQHVMLRTVSFVVCLVYRIRKNFTQTPGVEGIETFAQGLGDGLTPIEQNWQDIQCESKKNPPQGVLTFLIFLTNG